MSPSAVRTRMTASYDATASSEPSADQSIAVRSAIPALDVAALWTGEIQCAAASGPLPSVGAGGMFQMFTTAALSL
jgi:hypothetical protein